MCYNNIVVLSDLNYLLVKVKFSVNDVWVYNADINSCFCSKGNDRIVVPHGLSTSRLSRVMGII